MTVDVVALAARQRRSPFTLCTTCGMPTAPHRYPHAITLYRPEPARPAKPTGAFITVREVATLLSVSKMTVYRLIHDGELAAIRVGRSFRVREETLARFVAEAETPDPAAEQ